MSLKVGRFLWVVGIMKSLVFILSYWGVIEGFEDRGR